MNRPFQAWLLSDTEVEHKGILPGRNGILTAAQFPIDLAHTIPSAYCDPSTSVQSYQEGTDECELADEMGLLDNITNGRLVIG